MIIFKEIKPARGREHPLYHRLHGLILGGAVGDALGAPVEFMSRREILGSFGPQGIQRFAPAYGRTGAITDDTQMTLFMLEGLVRARVRMETKGICHLPSVIDHAYRRWHATQVGARGGERFDGWLISLPKLWSQRAPGNTCLGSLAAKTSAPFGTEALNDSKGAGALMRIAPIGLLASDPVTCAQDAGKLTHGHPTSTAACGWFAAWIGGITAGQSLELAAQSASETLRGLDRDFDRAIAQAFQLAAQIDERPAAIPTALGDGWVAEEAAAIALYCVLTAPTPFDALCLAVNINGDSDTTGSLVGQILGAAFGTSWIPPELLDGLELREEMETLVGDAAEVFWGGLSPDDPNYDVVFSRYPGS